MKHIFLIFSALSAFACSMQEEVKLSQSDFDALEDTTQYYYNEKAKSYETGGLITGLQPMGVKFIKASLIYPKQEIKINGKVALANLFHLNGIKCSIFLGYEKDGKVILRESVGTTNENGEFDLSFKISKSDKLYFENKDFYLTSYKIGALLKK